MPTVRNFDADLAAIDSAALIPPADAVSLVRKSLTHRHNLIVSRAARQAARLNLKQLTEDLAAAFRHHLFTSDPPEADPQCWAKNELAKTLAAFELQDHDLFLAGLRFIQLEPVWGSYSDTAGTLREICALALVQCRDLSSDTVLRHLTPLFRDKELPVRVSAARAIEQVGSDAAALLLRLRATLGADEPEVLGACIGGVLRIEGEAALPWVANFLAQAGDIAAEAAFVLAEHRSPQSVALLQNAHHATTDRDLRLTLLSAIATTRLHEATDWLLSLISSGALDARAAANALYNAAPSPELITKLLALGCPLEP
jgi:hypothetical protein